MRRGPQFKAGFTLVELIIVLLIVGVLATLSVPLYTTMQERVADKEAISNLKIVQAAEKDYMLEMSTYYPSAGSQSNIDTINQELNLGLPNGSSRKWNYRVWSTGCSRATRNGGDSRSWYMTINDADDEPDSGAGCP